MPKLGEIKRGKEIGYSSNSANIKFIWHACADCGKQRWVRLFKGLPKLIRCHSCAVKIKGKSHQRELSPYWKGGRLTNGQGYIEVAICLDDFFRPMAKKSGYVLEHRLVMAKSLGRCLHSWEIVHHKNHFKDDNRIENLQLVSDDRHKQITILENRITQLEKRVSLLEAENEYIKGKLGDQLIKLPKQEPKRDEERNETVKSKIGEGI